MNKPNGGWEQWLASIRRSFRAKRGWETRRKNNRKERLESWRAVKHPLASERDY